MDLVGSGAVSGLYDDSLEHCLKTVEVKEKNYKLHKSRCI